MKKKELSNLFTNGYNTTANRSTSQRQEKGKKNIPMTEIQTTGTQDRAIWVKLLWKISYPVIHNLAEGTLHQNMPIETRSGETAGYKDMTHLEAVGRTLAGVAPLANTPR